jgi:hypothetical protein
MRSPSRATGFVRAHDSVAVETSMTRDQVTKYTRYLAVTTGEFYMSWGLAHIITFISGKLKSQSVKK